MSSFDLPFGMKGYEQLAEKIKQPYFRYLILVSLTGIGILVYGVWQIPLFAPLNIFILLLLLAITAQLSTASFNVDEESNVTYQVSPAIAAAAIPFFGPFAAAVIDGAAALMLWLLKPADGQKWKKSWEQLAFNTGMNAVAMFCAGGVFLGSQLLLGGDTLAGKIAPWLLAAVVNDQVSLWLLIIIIRLQNGEKVQPLQIWRQNSWAMVISITLLAVGGGLLAFAIDSFGLLGGAVFFLPILLSSFAFRLYVRQMRAHLDNLEQIIAERTEELRTMMDERDAFLAVLTHDMKTPLTSIGLYADMLARKPLLLMEKPDIAGRLKRSQSVLLEIVENIVDLEKFAAGEGFPLNRARVEMDKIIQDVLETIQPLAQAKGISVLFDHPENSVSYFGDEYQLGRVMQNLVSNAVKYTPDHGQIRVKLFQQADGLFVQVKDNGFGIPQEDLPFIFKRFRRVGKHEYRASGTGLGLAITKALVEAHGGTIEVESAEEVGSTFTICLTLVSEVFEGARSEQVIF